VGVRHCKSISSWFGLKRCTGLEVEWAVGLGHESPGCVIYSNGASTVKERVVALCLLMGGCLINCGEEVGSVHWVQSGRVES
jgi:hypothetical protein